MIRTKGETWKTVALGIFFLGLIAGVLVTLENPTAHDDGLRHYVYAKTLLAHGIFTVPGWSHFLYEGTLSRLHVDPWFLSDVLIIPLTFFSLTTALKLLILIEAAFFLIASAMLLRSFKLKESLLPVYLFFLLFGNHLFFSRFFLARPFPILTSMFLLTLWAVLQRKWVALAVILMIATLLSHLFLFPLAACGLAVLIQLAFRRYRTAASIVIASITGVALGFLLHPHAGDYAEYLFTIFLKIPFQRELSLGSELGFGFAKGVSSVIVALLILIGLGFTHLAKKSARKDLPDIVLLGVLSLGLFGAQLLWLRAVDFLWPMLVVSIAFLHGRHPSVIRDAKKMMLPKIFEGQIMADILMIFAILQAMTVGVVQVLRDDSRTLDKYRAIEAVETGSRVLNTSWDSFPPFLSLRPDLTYATGMDPTFLHDEDPIAYELVKTLESGLVGTHRAPAQEWTTNILRAIPSDALVVRSKNPVTIEALKKVSELEFVTSTGAFAVFRVK